MTTEAPPARPIPLQIGQRQLDRDRQVDRLPDGEEGDAFSGPIAISGNAAIVAGPNNADNGFQSGSAYIFELNCSCPADIDGDGDLDAEDFFAYLDLFVSGDDGADIDGDGDIDAEDFFGYLDLFAAGCD